LTETYPPGSRLPGENNLIRTYQVARETARKALQILQDEGLTVTRKGVGVFVRDFTPIRQNATRRLSTDNWGHGRSVWKTDTKNSALQVDQISAYESTAPDYIAAAPALTPSAQIWIRDRRYVVDNKPVLHAISSLPAELVANTTITEDHPGPGVIYARLQDLGHEAAYFREEIRARMPLPEETEILHLSPGTLVITIARTAYTVNNTPVEVNQMTLDAGAYILQYDFPASLFNSKSRASISEDARLFAGPR